MAAADKTKVAVKRTDSASASQRDRRPGAETERLADALRRARVDGYVFVRGQLRQRPYATLAAALGAGYALGGGLTPSVLKSLSAAGSRVAVTMALQSLFAAPASAGGGSEFSE